MHVARVTQIFFAIARTIEFRLELPAAARRVSIAWG
jgi:hypothetical protein